MNELAQHMVDTVKEWQCKIGVRKEKMDLFYPLLRRKNWRRH